MPIAETISRWSKNSPWNLTPRGTKNSLSRELRQNLCLSLATLREINVGIENGPFTN